MENFHLNELISAAGGEFLLGDPHAVIPGISTDTRTIRRGDYYCVLVGKNYDGHEFIKQAIEKGAAGIILSRHNVDLGVPFPALPAIIKVKDTQMALGNIAAAYRKKMEVRCVGITGSNGKTTTRQMLASILNLKGKTHSNEGNLNNLIGVPQTLLRLTSSHRYLVVEMGTSVPGEICRLTEIAQPHISIITNIGSAHLENFKTREGVLQEKRSIFDLLPENGCAVINADDPYIASLTLNRKTITYGMKDTAAVRATKTPHAQGKPSFDLTIGTETITVQLPVYGIFNVYNALAAAAAAHELGASLEQIRSGLETFVSVGMRMQMYEGENGVTIINDAYNATPSSMRASLESLVASFPDRPKILVLGDMLELGETSEQEHRGIGELIGKLGVAQVYMYGPQMEKACSAACAAGVAAYHFATTDALQQQLKKNIIPGAVIFFKGSRGMKLEIIVDGLVSKKRV